MDKLKEINAAWANKIASTQLGEIAQKQLIEILTKIEQAAGKNQFNITAITLEEITQTELRNRGFKVKYYDGDPRDQRECGYFTISW